MHVAYLCWFQVIWSCWRANWKKRTWSCQTTRPPGRVDASRLQQTTRPLGRVEDLSTSRHHSTPWSSTAKRVTRSHHSTPWSIIITSTTWPSLDLSTRPPRRVSTRPPHHLHSITLLYHMVESLIIIHSTSLLDCQLQSLHSALNQTLEHKEEKKTPAYHSTSHSTTWV